MPVGPPARCEDAFRILASPDPARLRKHGRYEGAQPPGLESFVDVAALGAYSVRWSHFSSRLPRPTSFRRRMVCSLIDVHVERDMALRMDCRRGPSSSRLEEHDHRLLEC